MSNEIVVSEPKAGFLAPVVSVKDALMAYQAKKDLIEGIMRKDIDFGVIPGTDKPTLYKAGAEKATSFFGLSTRFKDAGTVEDWTGENHDGEPFFYYRRTCELWRGDVFIASADGSCNSWEKKYRYRSASRICPVCRKETIIKGKTDYGGGWICYAKKGGCGTKFKDGDAAIEGQTTGQVKNDDIADIVNTILKMADKRALVAVTLIATGMSDYFTQDTEDYISEGQTIIDAEPMKEEQPTPAPVAERPYSPEMLNQRMGEIAAKLKGQNVINNDRLVLAAGLEKIFADKTQRYEFCKWLTGESSTKKISAPYVLAMLKWMKVSSFEDAPDPIAAQEAHSAHSEALRAAGQLELPQ